MVTPVASSECYLGTLWVWVSYIKWEEEYVPLKVTLILAWWHTFNTNIQEVKGRE